MWPRGQRRRGCDPARFVRAMLGEYSAAHLGRLAGVSDRTIRRWAAGEDWCDPDALRRIVDALLPASSGSLPIYSPDMAIDGHTRCVGVGEYSRRAARGEWMEVTDAGDDDAGSG